MYESSLTLHYLETKEGDAVGRGMERGQEGDAGILQRRGSSAVCPTHGPALNLTNYSVLYPPISPSVIPPSFHTSLPFISLLCFYLFSHHLTPTSPFPFLPPARANNNLQGEIWLAPRRAEGGTVCWRSDIYTGNIFFFFLYREGDRGETRFWERERETGELIRLHPPLLCSPGFFLPQTRGSESLDCPSVWIFVSLYTLYYTAGLLLSACWESLYSLCHPATWRHIKPLPWNVLFID